MHVVGRKTLVEFGARHAAAAPALVAWLHTVRSAAWTRAADLVADFPEAEDLGSRTAFPFGWNRHHLVAHINFRTQRVFVIAVLPHAEADGGYLTP